MKSNLGHRRPNRQKSQYRKKIQYCNGMPPLACQKLEGNKMFVNGSQREQQCCNGHAKEFQHVDARFLVQSNTALIAPITEKLVVRDS